MLPKVSIIIPTYNRSQLLPKALDSALAQTYPNTEIIIVNDGSTDNTEEALAPYMNDIHYIKQENRGCAGAKNTGLSYATGELITNLDDDDMFLPQKVERQVEMFMKRPEIGICATGVYYIDANDQITGTYIPPKLRQETQVLKLLRYCFFIQSSVMIDRKCHEKLGGYKLMYSEDYDFWLRVALHYEIGVVKELLTKYRRHINQITSKENHPNLFRDVHKIILDFVENVPMEQIIPSLRKREEGNAILGLVLCEHKLFTQAEHFFKEAFPSPSGIFGLGMLSIFKKDYDQAKVYFEQVDTSHPLAAKVDEASSFITRIKELTQKAGVTNASPEAVLLRKDFSKFYSSVFRENLSLAIGEK